MAISVFISHSTNETDDKPFLLDLCQRLEAIKVNGEPALDVQVDTDLLHAGDSWRSKILGAVGRCQAGVVLLNRKAITESWWVHTEASILRWRQWLGEDIVLVLVLRGGGSNASFLEAAKWQPLAFGELQFLGRRREFTEPTLPANAFDELEKALKHAAQPSSGGRYEKLRAGVVAHLRRAFANAGVGDPVVRQETDRLLEEGPRRVLDLIEEHGTVLDPQPVLNVIELVAPWWIDPVSTCRLANAVADDAPVAYSFNGSDLRYTPFMYVRNACCQGPDFSWKVIPVTGARGRQGTIHFEEDIVSEVRAGLRMAYRKVWPDRLEQVTDEEINEQVRSLRGQRRPTFVALPPHLSGSAQIVKTILLAFPHVHLLLMTETQKDAEGLGYAQALEPLPDPVTEKEQRSNYNNARASLP